MKNDKNIKYSSVVIGVCVLGIGVAALGIFGISRARTPENETKQTEIAEVVDSNKNASPSLTDLKKETEEKTNTSDKETKTNDVKTETKETKESEKTENVNTEQKTSENTSETSKQKTEIEQNKNTSSAALPVDGKIVMDYSENKPVYDKTLDQYRTNDSVSIAANVGDDVMSISDGVVTEITKSYELGNSVVVDHGNGCLATYSQLKDDLAVKTGDNVKKGQILGQVESPTKYTSSLGSHVVFKVTVNGETVDPKTFMSQN